MTSPQERLQHLYEYGIMMTFLNGDRVMSVSTFIDAFKPPAGISEVKVTNLSAAPRPGNKKRLLVSMNIELVNSDSLFDFVISGMDEYQKSLFSNEISKIKDVLGRSSRIEVVRTNLSTGEIKLEMITPGEFVDDGTRFGGSGPSRLNSYSYRFEPLIISPTEVIKDIEISQDIDQNSNMKDPRNRAAAARKAEANKRNYSTDQKNQDTKSSGKNYIDKFYSESSLKLGTLDYGAKKSGFDTGRTGDFAYITIPGTKSTPLISGVSVRQIYLNGSNDIILTWRGKSTEKIDHFVIAAEVLGIKIVIGAAHNVSKSGTYMYVSKDFRDFVGGVKFHISPILNSGFPLSTVSTETIVIDEVPIDN